MLKQHKKIKRKKVKIVKGKKLLAALLSICMVLTLLPAMALAEGTAAQLPEVVDGVITLTSDVILEDTVSFDSGAITIDLNGYTLTSVGAENVDSYAAPVNKTVIKVSETADVTITDSATEKGMVIAGSMTNCRPAPQSTLLVEGGTLTIDGAVVKGATTINCRDTGEAIEVIGNETYLNVINGSKIIGSDDITDDSKDSNYGSKGNTYGATAIYAKTDGVITITDSEVIGGKGVGSSRNGGVGISMSVYSYKGGAGNPYTDVVVGTLNISSSIIKGGDSEQKNSEGEAINAASQGLIEDSDIIGGSAKGIGGTAVYVGSIAPVSKFVNCNIIGGNGETSWPGTGMEIFAAGGVEAENCIISGGEGMGESSYGGALWFYTETREPIHLKNCELVIVSDVVTAAIGGTATGKSSISTEGTLKIKRTGKDTLPSDVVRSSVQITWLNNPNLRYADATGTEYRSTDFKIGDTTYFTLSEALDNAQEGDTITIMPGVYTEGFNIPQDKNNITIEGSLDENGNYLTVFNDTCKVAGSNNTVKNVKVSVDNKTRLNIVGATDITVENCLFEGFGSHGISASGSASGTIKNSKFTNCERAIYIYTPGTVKIENNIIENALYGIHIETLPVNSSVTVEGNDIDCSWANSFGGGIGKLLITKNTFRSINPYYPEAMQAGSVNTYSDKTVVTENYFAEHAAIRLKSNANENGIAIKNNYFKDGIEKAFFDTDKPCSVYPYYSDEDMTKLVYAPANATDSEIVEVIENNTFTMASANATVETIKNLSTETQKEISAQKIEEIIVAQGTPVAEPTLENPATAVALDNNISVIVNPAAGATGNVILDSGENEVYSVVANEGTETDVDKTSTPVLIKIKATKLIEKVLHDHNGVIKEIPFTQDPVTLVVTFTMNEFSNIALVPAVTIPAGNAKLSFVSAAVQEEGKAIYDIVLIGEDFDTVKNFVSGEFTTTLTGTGTKPFEYVIEPINDEISVYYDEVTGGRKYHVNLKEFIEGSSYTTIADPDYPNGVSIAKMTVDGYGNGSITASGILMQKHDDSAENRAVEIPTIMGENAVFSIAVPTKSLTVNVDFNNIINNNAKDYQDMKIVISGGDLVNAIEYKLGNDFPGVTWNTKTYSVSAVLTLNRTYTVTVSGAGYRTARYNVTMEDDKVLNFWNNVKDTVINVEEGNDASAKKVTFLAGDIVKDNNINLYDLSAVVSYFGMIDLSSDPSKYKYAKYDLNRDGKIDSKDVAYVLVSWDN
jgi:hypothetical protein